MEGRSCPSFPLEHMKSGSFPGALCSGGSSSLPLCPREGEKEHGGQQRVNPQWVWLPDNRMGGMRSELHLMPLYIQKTAKWGRKGPLRQKKMRQTICLYFRVPFWSFSTAGVVLDELIVFMCNCVHCVHCVMNSLHKSPCDFGLLWLCPSTSVSREPRATVTQGTWKQYDFSLFKLPITELCMTGWTVNKLIMLAHCQLGLQRVLSGIFNSHWPW